LINKALNSKDILSRLGALHPKLIDLSLGRITRLLARLGHPERAMAPVIHVAGTNGKGSTLAFARAMLEAAGRRVHVYSSPHLVRFCERIRLAGELIDEDALCAVLADCEAANDGAPITYFEITTAAALLAFSRTPADVVLLEVGLGGRFDATNMIEKPRAVIITPVSMDHESFLGDRLATIAGEKAGIIKPGAPVFVAAQEAAALAVIEARASKLGAPLFLAGADWQATPSGDGFVFADAGGELALPAPALAGPWQIDNAATAIACLRALDEMAVDEAAIAGGLAQARWPARFQRLHLAGHEGELWLDGGHNPAAGVALAGALRALSCADRVTLILGMMEHKDAAGFLAPLAALVDEVLTVPIPDAACAAPRELARIARDMGLRARPLADITAALTVASGRRTVIAGSLYLAGAVLEQAGIIPD
jgi:dihydrofolate synthase/folylpolyglutamate synthase